MDPLVRKPDPGRIAVRLAPALAAGLAILFPTGPLAAEGEDVHLSDARALARPTLADTASARAEEDWLQETATLIQSLLDGKLPGDFVVQSLFEVDLLDESAVARRREALQARVLERRAGLGALALEDTGGVARRGDADSLRIAGGAQPPDAEARVLRARDRVDELRVAFLRLPSDRRAEINQTELRRRRLLDEKEAAQRARQAADRLAIEAEERRRQALARAQLGQSARLERLANEIARAETFHLSLARVGAEIASKRESEVEQANEGLQHMLELQRTLETTPSGSEGVWRVFESVGEELARARPRLRSALESWFSSSAIPLFKPAIEFQQSADSASAERAAVLRTLYREIGDSRTELVGAEREVRWQSLSYRADRVDQAAELRIRALSKLPPSRRGQVLGFTRHGVESFVVEVDQLVLSARFYVATRLRNIDQVPGRLRDLFTLGTATYILLRSLAVLLAIIFVRRHARAISVAVRRFVLQGVRDVQIRERFGQFVGSIGLVAPWVYFLLSLTALEWAVGDAGSWPEVAILFRTLAWYGVYRLVLGLCFRFVVNLTTRDAFNRDPARLVKLFTTLRTVLRVGLFLAIFLHLSERFLGRGFLFYLAANAAWIGAVTVVLGLLRGWREIISEAYTQVRPGGRLSALVRQTRNRWYGFVVGGAAFAWLAGRAGLSFARNFALGFDQVRKALAFFFRKRVEKRAEAQGYSDGAVEELPPSIVGAFDQTATTDDRLIIDHFPGLDRLEAAIDAWLESGTRGAFLVTGERGMGKTSWLGRVATERVPITRLLFDERVATPEGMWARLIPLLAPGLDPTLGGRGLEQVLSSGKPRVVILDGCHNLFLGTVGGYEAFEAFTELADVTRSRVFWLCAANANAWAHLESVRPDLAPFACRQDLKPWSEDEIRNLIETRTRVAGVELSYDDLLTDTIDRVTERAQTEEGYLRLLWDYADGNPRVALHFWLRSLVPAPDGRVRVRLFRAPDDATLSAIGEIAMFLLAAIVLHENLTVREAAAASRYEVSICRAHLDRLEDEGILEQSGNRFRLSTYWHRAVIRSLRRGNLIVHRTAA